MNEAGYSKDQWQSHYESGELPWDLGEVSPAFVHLLGKYNYPPGKLIIPGCGQGHEVLFFVGKGFEVTAVDIAPGAITLLKDSLQNRELKAELINQDFFKLEKYHEGTYDYLLEQTFFCAIHPQQRSLYVETAHRILKPKGKIFALFYETGEAGGPPFNTTELDIHEFFAPHFKILILKKNKNSIERRKEKEWLGILEKR